MSDLVPSSRWNNIVCAIAYVCLLAVTAVLAVKLLPSYLAIGKDLWHDAQSDEQQVASWRSAAVLSYTSGAGFGHVCALIAGMVAARWSGPPVRGSGVGFAAAAGAVLGLLNLAVAGIAAAPRLTTLAGNPELSSGEVIDPGLAHHPFIYAAAALTFVAFLIAASVGFCLAQVNPPIIRFIPLAASVVLAPLFHFMLMTAIVPGPSG